MRQILEAFGTSRLPARAMITAHSGCDGTGANTMNYLRYAAGMPVDALEIDVRRTKDGGLILSHDLAADAPPVTLEEAFRFLADSSLMINCDLKEHGLEDDVLDCAKRCGIERSRIIFTGVASNHPRRRPDARTFVNAEELIPGFDRPPVTREMTEELIRLCREAGYGVVNIDYRVCDSRFMSACRDAGLGLSLWTVDEPDWIGRFRETAGVVNITTNCVAAACGRSSAPADREERIMKANAIRKAVPEDVSRIAEIIVFNNRLCFFPIFQDESYSFGEMQVLPLAKEYLNDRELLARTRVYDDGVVKGIAVVRGDELEKLYVDPAFQGRGIGAQLLDHAVSVLGVNWLWALEKNAGALRFYARHGFLSTGEKKFEEGTTEYLIRLRKAVPRG